MVAPAWFPSWLPTPQTVRRRFPLRWYQARYLLLEQGYSASLQAIGAWLQARLTLFGGTGTVNHAGSQCRGGQAGSQASDLAAYQRDYQSAGMVSTLV